VKEAARKANADGFIQNLPQGYDTVTGERGFRLSGGQRQRIAIARTLLRDAPIVILDESVSNLDAENELYMQQILAEQLKDKTVVMIAHRLSTILSADRIIVLDNGSIADIGTHEELYENSAIYRNLIKNQMSA
jgi:ABC-type multidrug transport system fused ATPase/permease subunit